MRSENHGNRLSSADPPHRTVSVPQAAREQVIQSLGEHFAQDRLTMDEYERRVQEAWRAPSVEALARLTSDLALPVPAAAAPVAVADNTRVTRQAGRTRRMLALFSGISRTGQWEVPPRIRAIAVFGGIEIDLRHARLTSPVTEIVATAVMGGISVKVPPGVRLESDGSAILGGFADQVNESPEGGADVPIVRVSGFAFLGGVEATADG